MLLQLKTLDIICTMPELDRIPAGKILINTINVHSYNTAQKDEVFAEALCKGDYLIPDGAHLVKACRWLKAKSQPALRIAGWDLFIFEMERLEGRCKRKNVRGKVMFLGSSEEVLALIRERAAVDYPHLDIITYSPPFKPEFSDEENQAMIGAVNRADPDLLWISMTAPKQEKWLYEHWNELDIDCHVGCIGAVFDFYAGTIKRAPQWWLDHSLEWLYRLLKEPKRMWKRYLLGNPIFLYNIFKEWIK